MFLRKSSDRVVRATSQKNRGQHQARLRLGTLEDRVVPSTTPFADASSHAAHPLVQFASPADGFDPLGSPTPVGLTPPKVRHAYGIDAITFSGGTIVGDGTGQTIAIIDAFDDPNITADLHAFNLQFGLPDSPFIKVAQDGSTNYPAPSSGWITEIALDVEWAHAIAPGATIMLVEATDNSYGNLNIAVDYARNQPGVVAVSMSYGSSEFASETSLDSFFTTPAGHAGVTFLAASGDSGLPGIYPAMSPNVVAVGGTNLSVDAFGNYISESGWSGSGGGISLYEPKPSYQSAVTQSATKRTSPDISIIGGTGVAIYDSYNNGTAAPWVAVAGTSLSTPVWAGLIAIVDQGQAINGAGPLDGRSEALPKLYAISAADVHDITTGNNGSAAGPGYDLVTGIGTPFANLLIPDLVTGVAPQTRTWTGGGPDALWSDPLNWGGTAPLPGDDLVFGPGAAQNSPVNDFAPGTVFRTVRFSSTGYTVTGNAIGLSSGIDAGPSTGANSLNLNVTLAAPATVTAGGSASSLSLGGAIADSGFNLSTAGGLGGLTFAGILSGVGALTANSLGTVSLTGLNTYSGGTTLSSTGTLALGGTSPLGTGNFNFNAGKVQASGAAASFPNAVSVGGNVTIAGTLGLTFSGLVKLTGNRTLTVSNTATTTFSSGIGQTIASVLTKAGTGALILPVPSTYSGGTVLNGGTLQLGDAAALGAGAITVTSGTLRGNGSPLTLSNAMTLGGTLTVGGTSDITLAGAITLTGNRTVSVTNTAATTITGTLGQTGGSWNLTKSGAGTLALAGTNNLGGGTTLSSGSLQVNDASAMGTGPLTLAGGTLRGNGTALTLANPVNFTLSSTIGGTSDVTLTGPVTLTGNRSLSVTNTGVTTISGPVGQTGGTWTFTKSGTGLLNLSGSNTHGATAISAGTLAVTGPTALGAGPLTLTAGVLQSSGGPLSIANPITLAGTFTLGGANDLTFTGPATLTGNRTLTVTNTGTSTFAGPVGQSGGTWTWTKSGTGLLALTGSNTFGSLTLSTGTLAIGNGAALGSGLFRLNGGTVRATGGPVLLANAVTFGGNATIDGANDLTFAGAWTMVYSRTLTVSNTGTTSISGAVGQASAGTRLTKAGAGTLVISGANTYTGGTTVAAGTLLVNGTQAAGSVSVSAGATLGGSGTMGPISSTGGTINPGTGATGTGILNSGNLTLNSTTSFNLALNDVTAGTGYDQVNVTGTVNLASSALNLTLGFTPLLLASFTIVNNDGIEAVVGTFVGQAEGSSILVGGMTFRISYIGGTGNDVTLTRIA